MAKLERENKRLKEHLAMEIENNTADLAHQLEDASNLIKRLKKENKGLKSGIGGYASMEYVNHSSIVFFPSCIYPHDI